MVKKLILTVLSSLAFLTVGYAQRTSLGYDYLRMGELESAEKYFLQVPDSAESNFYLGEVAFAKGDYAQAEAFYNRGIAAGDENFMNEVGLAKLQLKDNFKAGDAALKSILKKDKKNIDLMITIGYAYFDNQLYDKANEMVEAAQKVDLNNPLIYILQGDILNATNDNPGLAAASYESAITFDPNFSLAYIKYANVYAQVEPIFAAQRLETLLRINPDYVIAYRDLGIIYRNIGQYQKAAFALGKYFDAGIYTFADISEYGFALYFAEQYDSAMEWLNKGLEMRPDDFILNRLRMYVASRTGNFENGLGYAEKFFSINAGGRTYLPSDHIEYANILGNMGMYDRAMEQFDKALALAGNDTERIQLYSQMIDFVTGIMGDNGIAADIQQRVIDLKGDQADVYDYTMLGIYFYNAMRTRTETDREVILRRRVDADFLRRVAAYSGASEQSLLGNDELFVTSAAAFYTARANEVFDKVISMAPSSYVGYQYKARIASQLDPEMTEGLARPHFERVMTIITESQDTSRQATNALIEAYKYLGVYSYQNAGDKNTALAFMNKVLELSPDDKYALSIIEFITSN